MCNVQMRSRAAFNALIQLALPFLSNSLRPLVILFEEVLKNSYCAGQGQISGLHWVYAGLPTTFSFIAKLCIVRQRIANPWTSVLDLNQRALTDVHCCLDTEQRRLFERMLQKIKIIRCLVLKITRPKKIAAIYLWRGKSAGKLRRIDITTTAKLDFSRFIIKDSGNLTYSNNISL